MSVPGSVIQGGAGKQLISRLLDYNGNCSLTTKKRTQNRMAEENTQCRK